MPYRLKPSLRHQKSSQSASCGVTISIHLYTTHAPFQYRMLCLRQANAEDEERMFGTLKDITKRTSSRRPGHIVYNALIRVQEETKHQKKRSSDKTISKYSHLIHPHCNSIISQADVRKHPYHCQALLEKIADFLVHGPGIWWRRLENGNFEFFDSKLEPDYHPEEPLLHHFRSTTQPQTISFLNKMWEQCLSKQTILPAESIRQYNDDGNLLCISTSLDNAPQEQDDDPPSEVVDFLPHNYEPPIEDDQVMGENQESSQRDSLDTTLPTPTAKRSSLTVETPPQTPA